MRERWWLGTYFLVLCSPVHGLQLSDIVFPPSGLTAPWACSLPDIFHVLLRSLGHIPQPSTHFQKYRKLRLASGPVCRAAISTLRLIHNNGSDYHLSGQGTGPLQSQMSKLNRSSLCASTRHTHIRKVASVGAPGGGTTSTLHPIVLFPLQLSLPHSG